MSDPIHIISLGAGVQSSTMALMAAKGEITPMPTCAIFADVGDEPKSVYEYLGFLKSALPFPVRIVKHKSGRLSTYTLRPRVTKDGRKYIRLNVPVFTKSFARNHRLEDDGTVTIENGFHWEVGKTNRKCTGEFKIEPILKEMRRTVREMGRECAEQWIGISLDEVSRMKESRHTWLKHRYPLVDLRMNRNDCLTWINRNGFPMPPRSACVFCPFHSDVEWRRLKQNEPDAFDAAVEFETRMRAASINDDIMKSEPFLHRSCKPLSEVDFSTEEERGQLNMFNNECEGMCGL